MPGGSLNSPYRGPHGEEQNTALAVVLAEVSTDCIKVDPHSPPQGESSQCVMWTEMIYNY